MWRVRVREGCRWPVVVVDGQQFTRQPVEVESVSHEIRTSEMLDVEELVEEVPAKRARK